MFTSLTCSDGSNILHQLWIGLYDRDHFNDTDASSNCECGLNAEPGDCKDCRNRFKWIDGTQINNFSLWSNSEPYLGERCVRLSDENNKLLWRSAFCYQQLGYICSRGYHA